VQEIEGVVAQTVVTLVLQIILKLRKIAASAVSGRNHLTIEHERACGQLCHVVSDRGEPSSPVEGVATVERHAPVLQVRLHTVPIQLCFVHVTSAGRQLRACSGE